MRLTIILAALAWSAPALAQGTPTERVSLSVGVAGQMSDTNFSQSITFEAYAETGSLTTVYTIAPPLRLNVGVVVRLWRGLGAGLAGTSFSGTEPGADLRRDSPPHHAEPAAHADRQRRRGAP